MNIDNQIEKLRSNGFRVDIDGDIGAYTPSFGTIKIKVVFEPFDTIVYSERTNIGLVEQVLTKLADNYRNIAEFCSVTNGKARFSVKSTTIPDKLQFFVENNITYIGVDSAATEDILEVVRLYDTDIFTWIKNLIAEKKILWLKEVLPSQSKLLIESVKVDGEIITVVIFNFYVKAIYVYKGTEEIDILDPKFNLALNKIELLKSM